MKKIRVENAVNCVCCHDITKIVPGQYKGCAFKKGHVITEADIPELRKLGKEHIFIWEAAEGMVHEDEAARQMAAVVAGGGIAYQEPEEGKITLRAQCDGVCVIDEERLRKVNMLDDVMMATRSNFRMVKKDDAVAGLRAIPLAIKQEALQQVAAICAGESLIKVLPLRPRNIGVVTTGNEVYHGLIQDQFGPFLTKKLAEYGCEVWSQIFCPDDEDMIDRAIRKLIGQGADLVLTTGGMSVDPDDVTPNAIRKTGATVVTQGTPVLPGAMLMVAYLGERPILGLPGGVMFSKVSLLDLLLPLLLADIAVTREYIASLGMGGLCLHCNTCHYPNCTFGTGA